MWVERPPQHPVPDGKLSDTMPPMPPVIVSLSARLRDHDPLVRLSGAKQLPKAFDRFGAEALPALLAGIDAAVSEPPPRQAVALHHALNRAWHAAARKAPEAAATWYDALIDRLCGFDLDDAGEQQALAMLLATLRDDPEYGGARVRGSDYAPLLRPHLSRVIGLLQAMTAKEVAGVGVGVGVGIDASGPGTDWGSRAHSLIQVLVEHAKGDAEGLAEHLRPLAARWSPGQLDAFARQVLLGFPIRLQARHGQ